MPNTPPACHPTPTCLHDLPNGPRGRQAKYGSMRNIQMRSFSRVCGIRMTSDWLMNNYFYNMPTIARPLSCHPDEGGIYTEYPDEIFYPDLFVNNLKSICFSK